jgi:hypothetical protein
MDADSRAGGTHALTPEATIPRHDADAGGIPEIELRSG